MLFRYTIRRWKLTDTSVKDRYYLAIASVIAEGKITTPQLARKMLKVGAYAVVVGGAITRPQNITKQFVDFMQK